MDTGSEISIEAGQLTINNLLLYGVKSQNLKNVTDNSNLILQNCNLILTDNFRFKYGGLQIIDSTISGFYGFNYESILTCSISRTVIANGESASKSPCVIPGESSPESRIKPVI